jgi:hypothetical protein
LLVASLPVLYRNGKSAENIVGSVAWNLRGSGLINVAKVNYDASSQWDIDIKKATSIRERLP